MDQIVLVQVSDVHIGNLVDNQGRFYHSLRAGFNPHDLDLCEGLTRTFAWLRGAVGLADHEPFYVLLSGDLTCQGVEHDFHLAHTLFRSEWVLDHYRFRQVGLGLPEDRLLTVPGNHDHWDGKRLPALGYNPRIMGKHFAVTPWDRTLQSTGGSIELELHGLDSNSGFQGSRWNVSLMAGGTIDPGEFAALERQLHASARRALPDGRDRVRALVVHHSFTRSRFFSATQALDRQSRQRLLALAGAHQIRALLTGHTHDFCSRPWPVSGGQPGQELWELRSATTLQGPAQAGVQGFWVHRLAREDNPPGVRWLAYRYQWNGSDFAVLSGHQSWVDFTVA